MIYFGSPSFDVLKVQNLVKLYNEAHALMLPEVEEWSHDRAARPVTPKNIEKWQQQWHDSNNIFHPPSSTFSRFVYEVHWISLKAFFCILNSEDVMSVLTKPQCYITLIIN